MSNLPQDPELRFVAHHYRKGLFSPDNALKKLKKPAQRIPLRRWLSVAASVLCLTLTLSPSAVSISAVTTTCVWAILIISSHRTLGYSFSFSRLPQTNK